MKKLRLSSVLLPALIIPFIMTYRLGIKVETPYGLFGLIFGLLLVNLVLDLTSWSKKRFDHVKAVINWGLVIMVIGSAYWSAIVIRHQTSPTYQIHDMPLQLEAAIRYFLDGKNPYAVSYFGTPLEQWHYSDTQLNPALFHFVMMPWYLIFSLPFYFFSQAAFGFFDARLPLLFLFGFLLTLGWQLQKKDQEKRRQFLVLLAFNPATLGYFLEGRSDIFMLAFMFWAWFWLIKGRLALSGIPLALALATKQSAWPVVPFWVIYLWLKEKSGNRGKKIKELAKKLLPLAITFLVVVLPFVCWDPKAFWQSTVAYLNGSTERSYPIAGYGWGMILHQAGIIKDFNASYSFWLWQLALGLPLLLGLIYWLLKRLEVWRLIAGYGIFLSVFWYFSRYFNNSHLGYLSMVFISSLYFETADKK